MVLLAGTALASPPGAYPDRQEVLHEVDHPRTPEDRPDRLSLADRPFYRHYVPSGDVLRLAQEEGATPYDIPGVELTHEGELCSFDAFLKKYQLDEPALQQLAQIVRGADTSRLNLTPQSAGLYAISLGLSKTFSDDHEMLRHGLIMYDALYAWCKDCQGESHNWPPQM